MSIKNLKNKGVKFGEGQDPTKGGAPKGKRVSTILKNLLDGNLDEIIDNPMLKGKEGNEALAVQLLSLAFHKDSGSNEKLSAIKEILDRIEGKSTQLVETRDTTIRVTDV